MRLIDAEKAHGKLTDLYKCANREARRAYSVAIDIVADADTIEAEPVRHGHWIEKITTIKCSNCGKEYNDEIRCMCYGEDAELKRCPCCGAEMEEKE